MRIDEKKKIIPYSYVGPPNLFDSHYQMFSQENMLKTKKTLILTSKKNIDTEHTKKMTDESLKVIDLNEINYMYNQYNSRIKNSNVCYY